MKLKILVATAGLALCCFGAFAQSKTKTKTETTTEVSESTEQEAKPATAQGPRSVPEVKNVPLAEHYEGGQAAMYEFIGANLQYPMMAKRNRIQGQCIISVTVNADGTTNNFTILKNIGGGCGEEALRVVKLLKFNAPGYSIKAGIPVNFKL